MLGNLFQRRPKEVTEASYLPSVDNVSSASSLTDDAGEVDAPVSSVEPHAGTPERDNSGTLAVFAELEANWRLAREPLSRGMVPLRTVAWDLSRQWMRRSLDPKFLSRLENVYADINLLTQLAWLSSEFGHQTQAMRDQYVNLSKRIAESLDVIVGLGRVIRGSTSH